MIRLIRAIKKAFADRQAQQKQIAKDNHNWEQAQLIVKSLEERGYYPLPSLDIIKYYIKKVKEEFICLEIIKKSMNGQKTNMLES